MGCANHNDRCTDCRRRQATSSQMAHPAIPALPGRGAYHPKYPQFPTNPKEYQKCNFPTAVDDRLQRDIFVIGLNETFKPFRSDIITRENLSTLTFAQVISKAVTLRLDSKRNQPSPNTTLKKRLTKSPRQLKDQRHPISPIDASRIDPQALQVARHALGVGVPPTLIAGTARPPTTLVMAVGNGVIGTKYVGPHPYMSSQKLRPALKPTSKKTSSSHMKCIRSRQQLRDFMLIST